MKKITFCAITLFFNVLAFSQLSLVRTMGNSTNLIMNGDIRDVNYFQGNVIYTGPSTQTSSYLYKTDGETATLIKDIGSAYPSGTANTLGNGIGQFNQTSNRLYFTRIQNTYNPSNFQTLETIMELWVTDGTTAGTQKLMTRTRTGNQFSITLTGETYGTYKMNSNFVGDKLIFTAFDVTANALVAYVTDGTPAGTMPLLTSSGQYIYGGGNGGTKINGKYYFGGRPQNTIQPGGYLYETDGTQAGTHAVNSNLFYISSNLSEPLNGKSLFWAYTNDAVLNSYELWQTDGTAAGTTLFTGTPSYGKKSYYQQAIDGLNDGQRVYFMLQPTEGVYQWEIWATDFNSTYKIRDLDNHLTSKALIGNGFVYFAEHNNAGTNTRYRLNYFDENLSTVKMLLSDKVGTPENFELYKGSVFFDWSQQNIVVGTSTVSDNTEVFRSDSTLENTNLVLDVYPGSVVSGGNTISNSSKPKSFFVIGDNLYFQAKVGSSNNIYRFKGDYTFIGGTNTNWNVGANWRAGITPGLQDLVNIPNGFNVEVNSGAFGKDIVANSPINLVSGNLNVSGNLSLGAKVTLNGNNLNLKGKSSSISGNVSSYVVTNSIGKVSVENVYAARGNVNLPIGTITNYNPITLSNSGTLDTFSARVENGVAQNYTGEAQGTPITEKGVNATWYINEGIAGGSNSNIQLQWNASQELPSFDRPTAKGGHYNGSAWDFLSGSLSGSAPYVLQVNGITSFSPFAVLNENALSVSENNLTESIKVYPNPSNGEFTIQIEPEMVGANADVYNIMGQKIESFELSGLENSRMLNKGFYFIVVQNEGKKAIQKITIK